MCRSLTLPSLGRGYGLALTSVGTLSVGGGRGWMRTCVRDQLSGVCVCVCVGGEVTVDSRKELLKMVGSKGNLGVTIGERWLKRTWCGDLMGNDLVAK